MGKRSAASMLVVLLATTLLFSLTAGGCESGTPSAADPPALFPVRVGDTWGYIDKTGATVIEPQFAEANPFSEGLAAARVGGKWGYIDETGAFVIQPQFGGALAMSFTEGLAGVAPGDGGMYGYIDKTGSWVIQPQYSWVESFSGGMARVWGSIQTGAPPLWHTLTRRAG